MLRVPRLLESARGEDGFTLIEVLVAMVTGIIVSGALFAILEVSMHQTSRVADVVQATQLGRTTMTHIVDELHSTCIASEVAPVQAGSTEKKLVFVNAYSEKAEIPSARKDEVVWNEATKTMTDYTYLSNGGTSPKFTYAATATPASGVLIGEHVTQTENEKGEKVPIFQYFGYTTKSSTSPTAPSSTLNSTPFTATEKTPLSAENALQTASVLISFKEAPPSNITTRAFEATSQVTLAFSAPAAETPVEAEPCE